MNYIEQETSDEIILKYEDLNNKGIEEKIILDKIAEEYNITQNKVNGIIYQKKNNLLILSNADFGNPDKNQKKIIDSFNDDFKIKMINHKLKYTENTIEIEINGEKIILDKVQPITKLLNWRDSMDAIEELDGKKSIDYVLFKKIYDIFSSHPETLGLSVCNFYWTSTTYCEYEKVHDFSGRAPQIMCMGFSRGLQNINFANSKVGKTICIHS